MTESSPIGEVLSIPRSVEAFAYADVSVGA